MAFKISLDWLSKFLLTYLSLVSCAVIGPREIFFLFILLGAQCAVGFVNGFHLHFRVFSACPPWTSIVCAC